MVGAGTTLLAWHGAGGMGWVVGGILLGVLEATPVRSQVPPHGVRDTTPQGARTQPRKVLLVPSQQVTGTPLAGW